MNTAYLILGGNKGDRSQNLEDALQLITDSVGIIAKKSDIFVTSAWGNTNQPDFLNQAICLQTSLLPADLLKKTISIEQLLGRVRGEQKWQERTMDIDILFYNNDVISTHDLEVPHPLLQDRKFVLTPLSQLAPELIHPVLKKNIMTLLSECDDILEVRNLKLGELNY